jgi:hypothetical protein
VENNYEISIIFHLLDDFLTVQPSNTSGHKTMALLNMIFNRLNVPISEKKAIGPTTCLEYLGIILDTGSMEARLPEDKVSRIIDFIESFLRNRSVRKRELLQLLGHFNFAARVVLPGRPFVAYLMKYL